MLDLSVNNPQDIAEAGYEFEILTPTGDKTGGFITVRGGLSKTVKAFNHKKYNDMQMKAQINKRKGKEETLTLEEAEDFSVESAVNRIIKWRGIGESGKEIPFSKEVATEILKKNAWIREQIMEESELVSNFRPE